MKRLGHVSQSLVRVFWLPAAHSCSIFVHLFTLNIFRTMRTLILLFLTLTVLQVSHAQRRDRSISLGFKTWPGLVKPMSGGRWLVVAQSETIPGKNYTDSIFAVIFNTKGDVLLRKRLDIPKALDSKMADAVVTQDGGFVVSISQGACDVSPNPCLIQKITAEGHTAWTRLSNDSTRLPHLLELAPDGNLIGVNHRQQVLKIDPITGETIWQAEMIGPKPWYDTHDFALIPGTELLIAIGSPDLQVWGRDGTPGTYTYLIANEYEHPDPNLFSFQNLVMRPDEYCYAHSSIYSLSTSTLFRFNKYGEEVVALKNYPFYIKALSANQSHIFIVAQRTDKKTMLLKTDFAGNILDTLVQPAEWHDVDYVTNQEGNVAAVGLSGSGPAAQVAPWERFNAQGLWFHAQDNTATAPATSNAAVTMVQQMSPLDTQSIASIFSPTGRFYSIKGGQFQVQVSNTGSEVLDEVDVMFSFAWSKWSICHFRSAHRRHYSKLNLAPGASILLEFGDLLGEQQHEVPTELCFWTASPNEKPDIDHSDDVFCLTPTVNAFIPSDELIALSPNPVSDELLVINATQFSDYQIHDLLGKVVGRGSFPAGQERTLIPVHHLKPSHYWLRIGTWTGQVVVAPR